MNRRNNNKRAEDISVSYEEALSIAPPIDG